MQMVTKIEKTLRKKQAESQTELEILRIKYGNLKVNYRSVDLTLGGLQKPAYFRADTPRRA